MYSSYFKEKNKKQKERMEIDVHLAAGDERVRVFFGRIIPHSKKTPKRIKMFSKNVSVPSYKNARMDGRGRSKEV